MKRRNYIMFIQTNLSTQEVERLIKRIKTDITNIKRSRTLLIKKLGADSVLVKMKEGTISMQTDGLRQYEALLIERNKKKVEGVIDAS